MFSDVCVDLGKRRVSNTPPLTLFSRNSRTVGAVSLRKASFPDNRAGEAKFQTGHLTAMPRALVLPLAGAAAVSGNPLIVPGPAFRYFLVSSERVARDRSQYETCPGRKHTSFLYLTVFPKISPTIYLYITRFVVKSEVSINKTFFIIFLLLYFAHHCH